MAHITNKSWEWHFQDLNLQQPNICLFFFKTELAFLGKNCQMSAFSSPGGWWKHCYLFLASGVPAKGSSRLLSQWIWVTLLPKFHLGAVHPFFFLWCFKWSHNSAALLNVSFSENAPISPPYTSRVYFVTPSFLLHFSILIIKPIVVRCKTLA